MCYIVKVKTFHAACVARRQRLVTVYHSTHIGSPHTFAVVQRPCRRRREATHIFFLMTFSYITFFSIPFFSIPFYCKRKSVDALFLSCIISWEQLTLTLVVHPCCGCPPYCVVSDQWRRLSYGFQENEIKDKCRTVCNQVTVSNIHRLLQSV